MTLSMGGKHASCVISVNPLPMGGQIAPQKLFLVGPDGIVYSVGFTADGNPDAGDACGLLFDENMTATGFASGFVGEMHGRALTYEPWEWPWDVANLGEDPAHAGSYLIRILLRYPPGGARALTIPYASNSFTNGKITLVEGNQSRGRDPENYEPAWLGLQPVLRLDSTGSLYDYPVDVEYEAPIGPE